MDVAFLRPRSLTEVHELARTHGEDARLLAGGTVLAILIRQRLLTCSTLISLQDVSELGGISTHDGVLRIGALATYRDIERSADVRRIHPSVAETAARVATPRIRNQATLGGCLALADPHFDLPVALIALDANVALASPRGTRLLPIERFAVDYYETALEPDELVAAVEIAFPPARSGTAFEKFLPRSLDDYAAADIAVTVGLDEAGAIRESRVVLGSLGPRTFRASAAEEALRGARPTDAALADAAVAAADACEPETDARGSREYKRDLVRALVPRVAREAVRRAEQA